MLDIKKEAIIKEASEKIDLFAEEFNKLCKKYSVRSVLAWTLSETKIEDWSYCAWFSITPEFEKLSQNEKRAIYESFWGLKEEIEEVEELKCDCTKCKKDKETEIKDVSENVKAVSDFLKFLEDLKKTI